MNIGKFHDKVITFKKRLRGFKGVRGYKAFSIESSSEGKELICRNFNFTKNIEAGPSKTLTKALFHKLPQVKTYGSEAFLCNNGFHFCKNFERISNYYDLSFNESERRYAIVEGRGSIDFDKNKHCATELKIVRLLTAKEVFELQYPKVLLGIDYNGKFKMRRRIVEFEEFDGKQNIYQYTILNPREYYMAKLTQLFVK